MRERTTFARPRFDVVAIDGRHRVLDRETGAYMGIDPQEPAGEVFVTREASLAQQCADLWQELYALTGTIDPE